MVEPVKVSNNAPRISADGGRMGKINWGRVFLGGLLGGVAVLAVDMFVNGVLFGKEWMAAYQKLGQTPQASALITLVVWAMLVGISVTWLYAATASLRGRSCNSRQNRLCFLDLRLRPSHDRSYVIPHFAATPSAHQ